ARPRRRSEPPARARGRRRADVVDAAVAVPRAGDLPRARAAHRDARRRSRAARRRYAVPRARVNRILVPLDHSEGSLEVVEYARALAASFEASLVLLHVYEPPGSLVAIVPGATVEGELAAEHAAGEKLLRDAVLALDARGFHRVSELLERAPSIVDAI